MGTLPAGLVAGNYYPIYDAYYQQVDPSNQGSVGAMESAKFLKTSGLSDAILSKIWDLADSNGKGFLTKNGFFVALKLVALVQAGHEPIAANLPLDVPPPKMDTNDRTSLNSTPVNAPLSTVDDWTMKPAERAKYEQLFDSMNPSNGVIPGNTVKGLLMDSKLPIITLGKIWELADIDQDGALDRHEFSIAMHLVYKALEKYTIPSCLPPELIPASKRKDSVSLAGAVQVLPAVPNGVRSETPVLKSITPPLTQPILSPPTVQPLSTSGPIRQPSLPQISSPPLIPPLSSPPLLPAASQPPLIPLAESVSSTAPMTVTPPLTTPATTAMFPADSLLSPVEESWVISQDEKLKYDTLFEQADLDKDGFVSGHEIKNTFLKSGVAQPVLAHIWALCDTAEQGKLNNEQFALALWLISRKLKGIDPPPKLTPEMVPPSCRKSSDAPAANEPLVFSSPEVDRLTKEIDDLVKEKLTLETNITQREADIKIKAGEIKSLQGELDALVATLKQLENQKGEAMKRINDLKTQNEELESELKDVSSKVEVEQDEVNKLKHQTEEQERNLKAQETELTQKKMELEGLKHEEANLTKERDSLKQEIAQVTNQSTETTEIINEIRSKLIELDDFQSQLKEAILHLDSVLDSKNVTSLSEVYLNIEPKFQNESYTSLMNRILKVTNPSAPSDPFADMNDGRSGSADFSKTDAFKNDPFDSKDPFASSGFNSKDSTSGFESDGFANFGSQSMRKADPFGDSGGVQSNAQPKEDDPFGGDPFAILHAPPRPGSITTAPSPMAQRSESPSPALPPKKCKQPPPRPAPPRPAPPSLPSGFDTDFADFSSFSHKMAISSSSSSSSIINNNSNSSSAYSTVRRELLKTSSFEKKNDPFRDYRYDDPFEMADEVDAVAPKPSAPSLFDSNYNAFDPFVSNDPFASPAKPISNGVSASKKKSSTTTTTTLPPSNGPVPSEDQQLAWATAESVKSEKERRKRAEQEKADMKKALKLSKADSKKRSLKTKVLF